MTLGKEDLPLSPYLPPAPQRSDTSLGERQFELHEVANRSGLQSPFRSVETPVAKRPFDAIAKEPPRSTERRKDQLHRTDAVLTE